MTGKRTHGMTKAVVAATAVLCSVAAPAAAVVFNGSGGRNSISGTNRADKIFLGAGNDRASGRGGADKIIGGQGRDRLTGGAGRDELLGGPHADRLTGSAGNDRLLSGAGKDTLVGGPGNDVFGGGSGADLMKGLGGRDRLFGGKGRDRILGGAGNDRLNSADGSRDRRVAGGAGRNFCRIDFVDLRVLTGCQTIVVGTGKGGAGGGAGGGGAGGGTGGGGNGGGATVVAMAAPVRPARSRSRAERASPATARCPPARSSSSGAAPKRAPAWSGVKAEPRSRRILGIGQGRRVDRDRPLRLQRERCAGGRDRQRVGAGPGDLREQLGAGREECGPEGAALLSRRPATAPPPRRTPRRSRPPYA